MTNFPLCHGYTMDLYLGKTTTVFLCKKVLILFHNSVTGCHGYLPGDLNAMDNADSLLYQLLECNFICFFNHHFPQASSCHILSLKTTTPWYTNIYLNYMTCNNECQTPVYAPKTLILHSDTPLLPGLEYKRTSPMCMAPSPFCRSLRSGSRLPPVCIIFCL